MSDSVWHNGFTAEHGGEVVGSSEQMEVAVLQLPAGLTQDSLGGVRDRMASSMIPCSLPFTASHERGAGARWTLDLRVFACVLVLVLFLGLLQKYELCVDYMTWLHLERPLGDHAIEVLPPSDARFEAAKALRGLDRGQQR